MDKQENIAKNPDAVNMIHLAAELSSKVVPILTAAAAETLKIQDYGRLELAKILVEDAIRYDNIYPYERKFDRKAMELAEVLRGSQ